MTKYGPLSQVRICRLSFVYLPFCSHFHDRCAMCWIEWKIKFPIFIFRVIVKIHQKLTVFSTNLFSTHLSCTFNHYWKKIYLFILMYAYPCMQNLSIGTIPKDAVNANLFRLGSTNLKKNIQLNDFFFLSIFEKKSVHIFLFMKTSPSVLLPFQWKMRNVLKRMKNQFSDFYFWSYGHFCTHITSIFDEFSR